MRRRLKRAAKKILWHWDTVRKVFRGKPFYLTESNALKVDAMVDELFRWEHINEFINDNGARFFTKYRAVEEELRELDRIWEEYSSRIEKIEKATGEVFPGIFSTGPTLVGEDEEGNYYQVVDGTIEKG